MECDVVIAWSRDVTWTYKTIIRYCSHMIPLNLIVSPLYVYLPPATKSDLRFAFLANGRIVYVVITRRQVDCADSLPMEVSANSKPDHVPLVPARRQRSHFPFLDAQWADCFFWLFARLGDEGRNTHGGLEAINSRWRNDCMVCQGMLLWGI